MTAIKDRTGDVVGRGGCLTAIKVVGRAPSGNAEWLYLCSFCGQTKAMRPGGAQKSASCGCRRTTKRETTYKKHGMYRTRTYKSWSGMRDRCLCKTHVSYSRYGGAGITICPEWDSFEQFYADMGDRPPGMTLDRIDGTKGYSAQNCRWATPLQQAINRRTTRYITIDGETRTVREWAEASNLPYKVLHDRLASNWDKRRAVTEPVSPRRRRAIAMCEERGAEGETKEVSCVR